MPLKLSLRPKEAVVVNGAVLRNGDRRGTILLQNRARVLRQKDVLQPEATESPAEHLYFAVMQMYLTGQTEGQLYDQTVTAIAAAMQDAQDDTQRDLLIQISTASAAAQTYQALSLCRKLLKAAGAENG
ncbi:MAG: flagellar biosynthesis repressor FlbT [Henriciella sp.]|nr:flagellar biosynthesis repressor FlbT [Paracoccaceae bacterium]NQY41016.1 flagellar biosynthesis repressor FlbT [Henriciella sp.]